MRPDEKRKTAPFDPEKIIKTLARHNVSYVLIGALAARLQGFPRLTADADITPELDDKNLQRLSAALNDLEARVYTDGVPEGLAFDCSAATLRRAEMWNLITSAGRMDIAFKPSGTTGYADLKQSAELFDVFGAQILVASLADIIRSKQAANRPQDQQDVVILKEMLARSDRRR
jgi:hypothetical protein